MYKVISIDDYPATRWVNLKNTVTGTIDECFDDSVLVSKNNFEFMQLGNEYKCKISLFGKVVHDMQDKTVLCKIVDKNVLIGKRKLIKVLVDNDEYYIHNTDVENTADIEKFYFRYARKDLIEVDNVIHPDCLKYE